MDPREAGLGLLNRHVGDMGAFVLVPENTHVGWVETVALVCTTHSHI